MSTAEGAVHGAGTTGQATKSATKGPRASFFRRLGAALLDGLILVVPFGILAAVLPDAATLINILYIVVSIAYYIVLEGGPKGQTLGKSALGIRVYDLRNGGPIGYGRAAIRYLGRILSTLFLFLGYFWMLFDGEKQTWHDKLAGSVVVPTDAYPV